MATRNRSGTSAAVCGVGVLLRAQGRQAFVVLVFDDLAGRETPSEDPFCVVVAPRIGAGRGTPGRRHSTGLLSPVGPGVPSRRCRR
jgi:hypothetical protein